MRKDAFNIISISLVFLLCGGKNALITLWQGVADFFKHFYPMFFDIAKAGLEEYLTSPYFITGVIMFIASAFGIWFGRKRGQTLFLVVSFICEVASLASILMNVM